MIKGSTHEVALPLLYDGAGESRLSNWMSTTKDSNTHKEETLITYYQVVNYLLETYETDDVISEAEADIMDYKLP